MILDQISTEEKFQIDVFLCVISHSPNKFLVRKKEDGKYEFPNLPLEKGKTPKTIASSLLYDLTGLTENWAAILSIGISEASMKEDYTDNVIILYACFIPEIEKVSEENVYWVDYQKIKHQSSPLTITLAHEVIYKKV